MHTRGMKILVIALLAFGTTVSSANDRLDQILKRVSEEAEVFFMRATDVVGRETLQQRVRKKPRRFRLRIGDDALAPPPIRYEKRQIVSEYGFSTLDDAPEAILEFRQIVSVDGRNVVDHEEARRTLTLGITHRDDRAKKRMLRRFEKHGLDGAAATDFGQILLLFQRRSLQQYDFRIQGSGRIGASETLEIAFEQRKGPDSFTVFEGREAVHVPLAGVIHVRQRDYVPIRIVLEIRQQDEKFDYTYESTVDYYDSAYGVLLPVSVQYRKFVEGELLVENRAEYSKYQMFAVDAEIDFNAVEPAAGEPQLAEPPPE